MMESRLTRNILANYLGKLWGIASVYLFVPIYINLLGIESYGVIAFQSVLLSIIWIADGGITPAFSREAARANDLIALKQVFFSVERIYLAICFSVAMILIACSSWFAHSWLKPPSNITPDEFQLSLALMSVGLAFQLSMNLYIGGLMGLQRQLKANSIQILYSFFRSGLVLLPLLFIPKLITYFIWQALMGLVGLIIVRSAMWRELPGKEIPSFNWAHIHKMYKFTAAMLGMAVIAALNTQMDKLIVSSFFDLSKFAIYSIASLLAQIPILLTLPIAIAVLPQLTSLVEMDKTIQTQITYRNYSQVIAIIASVSGIGVFIYAGELVLLWTGNASMAYQSKAVVQVLAIGSVCLALQLMPYHLSLANGHVTTNLKAGVFSLLITPIITWWLAINYGLIGAAFTWLILNAIAMIYLGKVLTRRFLPNVLVSWVLYDNLLPIGIAAIAGLVSYSLTDWLELSSNLATLMVGGITLLIFVAGFMYKKNLNDSIF
jgi:O-antigen/teichoic acid export membrane protein